jgi:hypothetical protein
MVVKVLQFRPKEVPALWRNRLTLKFFFQNKSGRVSHKELHDIMMTLLKMENISETEADELAPI